MVLLVQFHLAVSHESNVFCSSPLLAAPPSLILQRVIEREWKVTTCESVITGRRHGYRDMFQVENDGQSKS